MTVEIPLATRVVFPGGTASANVELLSFEELDSASREVKGSAFVARTYHRTTDSTTDPTGDRASVNFVSGEELAELFPTNSYQYTGTRTIILSTGTGFEYFGNGSSSTLFSRSQWHAHLQVLERKNDATQGVVPIVPGAFVGSPILVDFDLLNSSIWQPKQYGRGNDPATRNYTTHLTDSMLPGNFFNRWTGDIYWYQSGKLTTFLKTYDSALGNLYNGVVSFGEEDISAFGNLNIYGRRQSSLEGQSDVDQYKKDFGSHWPTIKFNGALPYQEGAEDIEKETQQGINTKFTVDLKGVQFGKILRAAGVTVAAGLNPNNMWTTRDYIDKFNYPIGDTVAFHGSDPKLTIGPIATVNICSVFPFDWVTPEQFPQDASGTTWNNSSGVSSKTIGNSYSYHLGKKREVFKTANDDIFFQAGRGSTILKWKGTHNSSIVGDSQKDFMERGSYFYYRQYGTVTSTRQAKVLLGTTNSQSLKFDLSAVGVTSSLTVTPILHLHWESISPVKWFAGERASKVFKAVTKKIFGEADENTKMKTVLKKIKKDICFQKNQLDAIFADVNDEVRAMKNELKAEQAAVETEIAALKNELKGTLAEVKNGLNGIDAKVSQAKTRLVEQTDKAVKLTAEVQKAETVLCKPKAGFWSFFF